MTYQSVIYEQRDAVALISFNRPEKRNAWNVPIIREIIAAIQRANTSEDVRAIVLTGEGAVYCAGADYKAPPEPKDASGRSPNPSTLTMGRDEYNWPELLAKSKPNIVAVNGPAIGLGATHILSADIRIAAKSATFSFPFLRLGAMPECGSTGLLPRLVGFGRALDICLRNRTLDAAEALDIGLISGLYPDEELRDAAIEIAAELARQPPLQVKLMKQMFYGNAAQNDFNEILRIENVAFIEMLRALKREKPL